MPVLEVRDLRTEFTTDEGSFPAVDGVSLSVEAGKTLAIVGESGCGKSVTALSIMGLVPDPPGRITGGSIRFEGRELVSASKKELLDLLFSGHAHLADALERHMSAPLPIVGAGEPVSAATAALEKSDALLVHDDGKPAGVLTRQDLLGFLAAG